MKAEMNPLLNTWSLSVEEQFYIIFPLLLYIGWKIGKKFDKQKLLKYFPTILVTTFMIGSFVLALIGSQQSDRTSILGFYSPFSRAWEFAAGSLLALYYVKRKPPKHMIGMIASTLGAAMIIIATMVISEYTVFPSMWTLLPVFATLLLIYSGETSNPISALLSINP
jgi:peptidoglycan/LPS O-acetylase OafA/YrhL